jgi:hypothetical protein
MVLPLTLCTARVKILDEKPLWFYLHAARPRKRGSGETAELRILHRKAMQNPQFGIFPLPGTRKEYRQILSLLQKTQDLAFLMGQFVKYRNGL